MPDALARAPGEGGAAHSRASARIGGSGLAGAGARGDAAARAACERAPVASKRAAGSPAVGLRPRLRVLHVIPSLGIGGAETMLLQILAHGDGERFEHEVVALAPEPGSEAPRAHALGARVRPLGARRAAGLPRALARLWAWTRASAPDVVHTWMYHANLLGGLAAAGAAPVLWAIRRGRLVDGEAPWTTHAAVRLSAALSRRIPRRIVCCTAAALEVHRGLGFDASRMLVVPNGFDTERFAPSEEARQRTRAELGLGPDDLAIGLVARFHPVKDHATFLEAAARAARERPELRFVLAGPGVDGSNGELVGAIAAAGLGARFRLLGPRRDVPALLAGLDLATLCSRSEGFPNAVGEAMACGLPCVLTEVGDARSLVGPTGRVVPVGDPEALARAWLELGALGPAERRRLGRAARRSIEQRFSIAEVVRRYERLYLELAGGEEGAGAASARASGRRPIPAEARGRAGRGG